ncbi:hypothetical protein NBRC110019_22710 [Neptunitalea chrysea]|uniref:Uncharacterized protein n=1 Tax=Neptunitalea chrysea TaxID=1647581 RepID=A0A9W6B645_9FLAO|nr:hypothetical protein [Neptunitalea chrysea]GLB53231.1 hypothetical protein NBRC110019_22710 [Neptunitalea chrysea]
MTPFTEKQKLGNWIFILLGVDFFIVIAILFNEYYNNGVPLSELYTSIIIITTINVLLVLTITNIAQYTLINKEGIHYKYTPFVNKYKTIPLEKITSFQIESYDTLNYGYAVGKWNFFSKTDMVTQMGLEKVIRIEYGAKKPIIIGSQKPNEFYTILKKLRKPENDE